jgi:hypothetical protein
MKKINKEAVLEFAKINRYFMGVSDMAKELDIPHPSFVAICDEAGLAVRQADWCKEYIVANPGKLLDEYAALLNVKPDSIKKYLRELDLPIVTGRTLGPQKDFTMSDEEIAEGCDRLARKIGYAVPMRRERIKDKYNQSSSPFGFADELRGLPIE